MATPSNALATLAWCEVCEEPVPVTVPAVAHAARVCLRCLEGEQDVLAALRDEEALAPRDLPDWPAGAGR